MYPQFTFSDLISTSRTRLNIVLTGTYCLQKYLESILSKDTGIMSSLSCALYLFFLVTLLHRATLDDTIRLLQSATDIYPTQKL